MIVEKVVVGQLEENCYILKKDKNAIIIDPGDEFEKIDKLISGYNLLAVLITHAHFDHVGALNEFIEKYKMPVYYHNVNNEINYEKIVDVKEKDYKIENFNFKVIFTPGHRNDLVIYYFDNMMFVGDFIFKGSIGRVDLEYSNPFDMQKSLKKIKEYKEDITIYPGHGDITFLKDEKENNIYLV